MSAARIQLYEHQLWHPECVCMRGKLPRTETPRLYPCIRCGSPFELSDEELCTGCSLAVTEQRHPPLSGFERLSLDTEMLRQVLSEQ